jgi:tetratricopeptide (TPR) repeat protein/DNA-binding winged helix-turn-helix (wHTH) protein
VRGDEPVEFMILGQTALVVDGRRISLGAAQQRGMLALLLYHVGEAVRVDAIIEQLWDGQPLRDRRRSLYALASRIRAVLARVGMADALVRVHGSGAYRLNVDPELIDFHRFRAMMVEARHAARQHHHDTVVALLTEATGLWRDEPVADLRGARSEHIRRHMNELLFEAHRLLAGSQLRLGQYQSVLTRLEPIMRANDLDETLAQHWITALCAAGQAADARSFLLTFRRRFRKEMRADTTVDVPPLTERGRLLASVVRSAQSPAGRVPVGASNPNQLPKDINDFTGHARLLSELDKLTDPDQSAENIVVITGMPGIGKTTLATHWANQRRHRFPDGQLYLNCRAHGPTPPVEPDDALRRFLLALGTPADPIPAGEELRRDRLNQLLTGLRVLLILDNIRDSDQARRLIPASATCVTLITSRNRLKGLTIREGVRTITVPPLPDVESLALLSQTIGIQRAAAEPGAVQTLAQLSGGLPLALRIIGEHVAERPQARIGDLVEELGAHLINAASDEDEETSLHTVFAWSYQALGADAARLFRTLGLHPGSSISPEASAAMVGVRAGYAEQILNTLAKAHLINHGTARRYRFHDLLRLYAKERACCEESFQHRQSAMRRLLDWYLLSAANAAATLAPDRPPVPDLPERTGVEPKVFTTDRDAMKWCEEERGNLGAVTRWAVNNGFHRHGWQIPGAIYEIFERYGRQDDVLELHQLALTSAKADGHAVGQLGTLNNLGATYFALHDYERAASSFEAGLRLAREVRFLEVEASCSHNLASVHLKTGKVETAVRIYREVLETCRLTPNPHGEASILHRLGDAFRQMGQYDEAIKHYQQALTIREQLGSLRGQGVTHGEIAALYLAAGENALALSHCRRALDIHNRTKDEPALCDSLITATEVERELAMYDAAIQDGQRAAEIGEEIADSVRRCRALTALAATFAAAGRSSMAHRFCHDALAIVHDLPESDIRDLRDRLLTITASTPTGGLP